MCVPLGRHFSDAVTSVLLGAVAGSGSAFVAAGVVTFGILVQFPVDPDAGPVSSLAGELAPGGMGPLGSRASSIGSLSR